MLDDKLAAKIEELYKVAKLYEELTKKLPDYQYRLDAIYLQIEILEELRDDEQEMINIWMECYKEDSRQLH